MNDYYVYAYLDTRKPGNYKYGDMTFDFEPFYIGKGKRERLYDHLKIADAIEKTRNHKLSKIKNIIKEGLVPKIIKLVDNVTEDVAYEFEIKYIKVIGRHDTGVGPLCNLTDGGDGARNINKESSHIGALKREEIKRIKSAEDPAYAKKLYDARCAAAQADADRKRAIYNADETARKLIRERKQLAAIKAKATYLLHCQNDPVFAENERIRKSIAGRNRALKGIEKRKKLKEK
jgi:hypothetical protein